MNNCAGVGRDVIVSKEAFETLVRASLQQLHSPTQQCLSMVTRELLHLAQDAEPAEVMRCATPAASCAWLCTCLVRCMHLRLCHVKQPRHVLRLLARNAHCVFEWQSCT